MHITFILITELLDKIKKVKYRSTLFTFTIMFNLYIVFEGFTEGVRRVGMGKMRVALHWTVF